MTILWIMVALATPQVDGDYEFTQLGALSGTQIVNSEMCEEKAAQFNEQQSTLTLLNGNIIFQVAACETGV